MDSSINDVSRSLSASLFPLSCQLSERINRLSETLSERESFGKNFFSNRTEIFSARRIINVERKEFGGNSDGERG